MEQELFKVPVHITVTRHRTFRQTEYSAEEFLSKKAYKMKIITSFLLRI